MPIYTYECSECGRRYEEFASMSEYDPNNLPHCPHCDPEELEETTLFRYMGDVRPAFQVRGEGAYDNGLK